MLRQQTFSSETLNWMQFNFIAQLIAVDIYANKNVLIYGKRWSGKSKIADILASISEREMFTIAKRIKKEKLLSQLLSNHSFFGRNYSYWTDILNQEVLNNEKENPACPTGNCPTAKANALEEATKDNNANRLRGLIGGVKDINATPTTTKEPTEKEIKKAKEDFELHFGFKPEAELAWLKEPYKTIYEACRVHFNDVFFISFKLDILRTNQVSLTEAIDIILATKHILPYKKKYVFIVDNFMGYNDQYEKVLLEHLDEYNAQGIQFVFISDEKSIKGETYANVEMREIDNSLNEIIISDEIITSMAQSPDQFGTWLKANKKKVFDTVVSLKQNKKFFLWEPWATETFLLNMKQEFMQNHFSTFDLTKKLDLKALKENKSTFNMDKYIGETYAEEKKTKLLSKEALAEWYLKIKQKIFGQDKAIKQLMRGIYSSTARGARPRGVYMLLGSTGIWKTESVKCISEILYGSREKDKLMIIPMEQYNDITKLNILQGSPAGYVGYDDWEKNNLATQLKKMGEGIILFDEIEKAHKDVIKALLTTLEEWKMQMGNGEKADLSNFTLLFTSNAIVDLDDVLKSKSHKTNSLRTLKNRSELTDSEVKTICLDYLKEEHASLFSPEFLNRFNDFILYEQLGEKHLVAIMKKKLKELKETYANIYNEESGVNLKDLLATVSLSEDEQHTLIEETIRTKMGARYMNNKIQEIVNAHQDILFNFDENAEWTAVSEIEQQLEEDYQEYLAEKNERMKNKDIRLFTQDKLKSYYNSIIKNLYWQNEAVAGILMSMYSAHSTGKKPKWVFMLTWPTGVGKTETWRLLAKEIYWSMDKLYKVPMDQYTQEIDINKLKGAPAGYVGYWDATLKDQLEKMWGEWILLFDEIEKAHPTILQALLVALEDGKMEMQNPWQYADFGNFTVIFTTNAITDADALIKEFKESHNINEDWTYEDVFQWKTTVWFDTRSEEEKKEEAQKAKEDVDKKTYDFNTYDWVNEFITKCLKEAENPATRRPYFSPEFLGRMDAFFYYRGFYKKGDQQLYIDIANKWQKEQYDLIDSSYVEGQTDMTKEDLYSFIEPNKDELVKIIENVTKNKLGIRKFIKSLEEMKNKRMQKFMWLTSEKEDETINDKLWLKGNRGKRKSKDNSDEDITTEE